MHSFFRGRVRRRSGCSTHSPIWPSCARLRVGMLAELNPALSYADICKMLIEAEARGGDVGPVETAAHSIEQVA
ncbi:TA system antitoxin ParD family protein [Burkholderia sola]|uniref:TA system antitoxin ParD family protein n=1 Tax=Burkholderia sola TaxID=2843302 RepID=UPI003B8A9981